MKLLTSLCLVAFLLQSVAAVDRPDDNCVYTLYVKTWSFPGSGTDAIIGAKLYNAKGKGIWIKDLKRWGGLMGPKYNYFERGNLDVFSGRGPCLAGPVCALNVTSDGSGKLPRWNCETIQVTSTWPRVPPAQELFNINQWLAGDVFPFKLYAYRNKCPSPVGVAKSNGGLEVVETASFSYSSGASASAI